MNETEDYLNEILFQQNELDSTRHLSIYSEVVLEDASNTLNPQEETTPADENFVELNSNKHSFEKLMRQNLYDIFRCFTIIFSIYYRTNLFVPNSYYRAETRLYLFDYFYNFYQLDSNLNAIDSLKFILQNDSFNLDNYYVIDKPTVKLNFNLKDLKTCESNLDYPFNEICPLLINKTQTNLDCSRLIKYVYGINSLDAKEMHQLDYLKSLLYYFNDFSCDLNLIDDISYDSNCNSYLVISDNLDFLDCLQDKEIRSIKLELALVNNDLKQMIYVNLFLLFLDSGARNFSLSIQVISPDRMITFVNIVDFMQIKQFIEPFVCMLIIYIDLILTILLLVTNFFKNQFEFNFSVSIDIVITTLIMYLLYLELKMHYILKFDFKNTTISLFKLAHLSNQCDLVIGLVYVLVCFKSLPMSKFTEIITHIMLTFQRSLTDLIGFFIVFIFFLISYSFELHYLLGEHFCQFSTLTKSFAALFRLIWGDIDFNETSQADWKSFYFFLSYLIFMIIIMFNLMLAIILGTYDSVKNDPTCRGAYYRLDEYILVLFDRYFHSNKLIFNFLFKYTNIKSKLGLFCVYDIQKRLKMHFESEQVDYLLNLYNLKPNDQIDKFKCEILIRNMFQLDFNSKPKLRINNTYLAGDYVSDQEWKKLTISYDDLETFCALFERRLDVICDALLCNLNTNNNNNN